MSIGSDTAVFHDGRVVLRAGDCLSILDGMASNSVDAVCCDPPYHLASIVKRFGADDAAPAQEGTDGAFVRASRGFMGKQWDGGDIAFQAATWAKVLRVLKPGGHLVAFAATKNSHRMVCAIEDAGFEVRDCIAWLYASGFPKSLNLDGDHAGRGTALKPAYEPICLARKPLSEKTVLANVLRWGTGAIEIDGCRIHAGDALGGAYTVKRLKPGATLDATGGNWRPEDAGAALYHGEMKVGRWPANVAHDGSDEVVAAFPESVSGGVTHQPNRVHLNGSVSNGTKVYREGDCGSSARFFFSAKADADDRLKSKHPTVKPVDLMRWLVRMVCPKGGVVLDPFAGTGTTAHAALIEGMSAILIEREAEYQADIARRMELVFAGQTERRGRLAEVTTADALPLFGGAA